MNKKLKNLILQGCNIALTGAAGCGKSYQVHKIIENFENQYKITLTATTGIAATNINGQTIHSFLNLGMIRTNDIEREVERIIFNPYTDWTLVRQTDILIIDEMSMCDGFLFNLIDEVLRKVRNNIEPFGGLQVILVFDCYQLPPVEVEAKGFFFESQAYAYGNFKPVVLKKVYRQNDKKFIDCLNRIRIAQHTDEDIKYLQFRQYQNVNYALLDTTCLYPTNAEADTLNTYRLGELEGEEFVFESKDTNYKLTNTKDYNKVLRVPQTLKLKRGARVMLLSNLDVKNGLCNGSVGTFERVSSDDLLVCNFYGKEVLIKKQIFEVYEKSKVIFTREQFPLILGWSISIHKSQGMSLDSVAIDFAKVFAPSMAYVALSRAREYNGLYLKNLTKDKIFINPKVVEYMESLEQC